MIQVILVISLWGLFIFQPLMRSMKYAEPVLKLIFAIALGLGVALTGFINVSLSPVLIAIALIFVLAFIATPALLNMLIKAKRYFLAKQLNMAIYWTEMGRKAMQGFLARAALQRGDAEAALELLPPQDPLMMRAYALQQKWDQVLVIPFTGTLESHAARIEAFIAKGNSSEAEHELALLKQVWEKNQTAEGYRILMLSETRLEAEKGHIEKVQKNIQTHLVGLPTYLAFALLARVAETSYNREPAKNLYTQAYLTAPESQRAIYRAKLQETGQALPEITPAKTPYGTFILLATIALAFLVQLWLENRYNPNLPLMLGAFLLNHPEIPENAARWRFLSFAFLHGGVIHFAVNSWSLYQIGGFYEIRRSWGSLLASFVLGSIMGAYFVKVAQATESIVLVGASGGLFGISGSILTETWRSRSPMERSVTRSLLFSMGLMTFISLQIPGISFWGHTGGLVGGLLWGFIRQGLPKDKRIDWFVGGLSIGLISYTLISIVNLFFETHP